MKLLGRWSAASRFRDDLEANRNKLYRMAYAWCGDAMLADDLTQDTLTKALQKNHQLRDPGKLGSWLCSILYNCWREHLRRNKTAYELDENKMVHHHTPEVNGGEQEIILRVRRAIASLPEGQREVITLVDLEGLSYTEVAGTLQVPMGTVMSRLSRARKALHSQLLDMKTTSRTVVNLRSIN